MHANISCIYACRFDFAVKCSFILLPDFNLGSDFLNSPQQVTLYRWNLIIAHFGQQPCCCRLSFVLGDVQMQGVKNQVHCRLYLQISSPLEKWQDLEVQACAVTAHLCACKGQGFASGPWVVV